MTKKLTTQKPKTISPFIKEDETITSKIEERATCIAVLHKTLTCTDCGHNKPLPKKPTTYIPGADSMCTTLPPQLIQIGGKILMMYNRTNSTFPICQYFKQK